MITGNVLDLVRGKEVRFLTLTIKTEDEPLSDSLDKIYNAFQKLRRRRLWTKAVDGGVAFLENKWSETGGRWHPHLHCLLEGRYLHQSQLARAWHEITGDSWVVDIRRPPNNESVTRYVTKYAGKPFNNTFVARPKLIDEAIVALAGRKLALTFGRWRGLKLTKTADDGSWEHVSSLESLLVRAASGEAEALKIVRSLTNQRLDGILPRSPPTHPTSIYEDVTGKQLSWFGTWSEDGTFQCPTGF